MKEPNTYYDDFYLDSHGGECCGVMHLYEFSIDEDDWAYKPTLQDKITAIHAALNGNNHTIEVVLTRQQAKFWETALYRCGFKRVLEFSNPNTNNILRMYLSTNNQVKPTRKRK